MDKGNGWEVLTIFLIFQAYPLDLGHVIEDRSEMAHFFCDDALLNNVAFYRVAARHIHLSLTCSPTSPWFQPLLIDQSVCEDDLILTRSRKKHLKRLAAPSHWMLDKLSGTYAPRPSAGPHKLRESLPLIVFLRNRLKYALNGREVKAILMQEHVKVDGKVRTDSTFPAGFMDVITLEATNENFRLIYDVKGRFTVHRITAEEASYKLGKVRKIALGKRGVPYAVTHDGRTIRYPDPLVRANDTVKIDLATGKMTEFIKFDTGKLAMVTGGKNMGRVGVIVHREKHEGGFDLVHIKDALENTFVTRQSNVFIIGTDASKPYVSLPKGKGIKLSITEERDRRRAENGL